MAIDLTASAEFETSSGITRYYGKKKCSMVIPPSERAYADLIAWGAMTRDCSPIAIVGDEASTDGIQHLSAAIESLQGTFSDCMVSIAVHEARWSTGFTANEPTFFSDKVMILDGQNGDSVNSASTFVRSILNISSKATVNASKMSKAAGTLGLLRSLCRSGEISGAVDRCFEVIEIAFARRDLPLVNELLDGADPAVLDSRVTVGMLRATSRAKDRLPAWPSLLLRERRRLKCIGRDEKRMLRGLLSLNGESTFSDRAIT
jgi:hypothetical protein